MTKASLNNNQGSKLLFYKGTQNTLNKTQKIIESEDSTLKEIKGYKKKITDFKNILTKFEEKERPLISLINDKEKELNEMHNEIKNKINNEKYLTLEMKRIQSNFVNEKLNLEKELNLKKKIIENLLFHIGISEEDALKILLNSNACNSKPHFEFFPIKNNNQKRNFSILKDSLLEKAHDDLIRNSFGSSLRNNENSINAPMQMNENKFLKISRSELNQLKE